MALLQIKNPLDWPENRIPTERLMRSMSDKFQQDLPEQHAVTYLEDEINTLMGVDSAVLSVDALNINSTLPTQYLSHNTGACLKLNLLQGTYFLACDKWQKLAHNIYVLHLALRHFKQLESWGLGEFPTLIAGFSNIPSAVAPSTSTTANNQQNPESWASILGLGPTATIDDANAIYRYRAMQVGETDPEALQTLNLAIQQARKALAPKN